MKPLDAQVSARLHDESGQGLAEYGLLLAVVVVLVTGAGALFRDDVVALVDRIGTYVEANAPVGRRGNSVAAPGHGSTPPGQGGTPPGQT